MNIVFDQYSPNQVYHIMTQSLIPRPIAWVLTENATGSFNLAPFSYFTPVSSKPAVLMLSLGQKSDRSNKDTWSNIKRTGRFTVHIASDDLLEFVNESSRELALNESELDLLGLEVLDDNGFKRLAVSPIAYDCYLHDQHLVKGCAQQLIFGEVRQAYAVDSCVSEDEKGRLSLDAKAINPLARLGANEYASLGDVLHKTRPK